MCVSALLKILRKFLFGKLNPWTPWRCIRKIMFNIHLLQKERYSLGKKLFYQCECLCVSVWLIVTVWEKSFLPVWVPLYVTVREKSFFTRMSACVCVCVTVLEIIFFTSVSACVCVSHFGKKAFSPVWVPVCVSQLAKKAFLPVWVPVCVGLIKCEPPYLLPDH